MKVYENKNAWIIEDYLDVNLVEEIRTIIKDNLNNLYKNKEGYSTTGKNSEQYWLIHQGNNFFIGDLRFYHFEKEYKNQILNRIKAADLFDKNKKDIYSKYINAWSVIGEENSYHTMHCHNGGIFDVISTLVYLEVPETNVKNESDNNIFLVTDLGPRNPFYNEEYPYISINPEVGKLLIFPGWVLHGTYPQTKGIRQTFNLDYGLRLKENNKNNKLSYS